MLASCGVNRRVHIVDRKGEVVDEFALKYAGYVSVCVCV